MFSTIKRKTCKCGCSKMPTLGYNGYSYGCAPQDIKDKVGSKKKVAIKNRNARNRVRMLIDKKPQEQKNLQELWFSMVALEIEKDPHCWNCGEFIPEKYYRHASAHVVAKSIFVSVATHPMNFIILGAGCGCHHEYDSSIEAASKMQVWRKATERFKEILPYIKERHKILDLFKEKITT